MIIQMMHTYSLITFIWLTFQMEVHLRCRVIFSPPCSIIYFTTLSASGTLCSCSTLFCLHSASLWKQHWAINDLDPFKKVGLWVICFYRVTTQTALSLLYSSTRTATSYTFIESENVILHFTSRAISGKCTSHVRPTKPNLKSKMEHKPLKPLHALWN